MKSNSSLDVNAKQSSLSPAACRNIGDVMNETSQQYTSTPEPGQGPALYGVVDVLRPDRIAGWAIDRRQAAAAIDVLIQRHGKTVARVRADRVRKDLEKAEVGTGRYGFSHHFDPPLEPGAEGGITAKAVGHDGVEAVLRPVRKLAEAQNHTQTVLCRILDEIAEIRSDMNASVAAPDDHQMMAQTQAMLERMEVSQARLELCLAPAAAATDSGDPGHLRPLIWIALALGAGSLCLGLWSMIYA
jgi:hypothetical protein